MIYLHATIGEHTLEVAIVDRELKIPADRPQDDLRRELPALEQDLVIVLHRGPSQLARVGAHAVHTS